ncbi:gametogenetin [Rhinatrema bivittatum]|uniref:gametogenetin n=1 Tax=Rhinatrema bivittatum TaxID=194408 RepID=UPI00112A6F2C|nr:gametogenetin [Rhinatrema bivittatum]
MGNVQSEACQEPEPAQSEERNPEHSSESPGCVCTVITTDHAPGPAGNADTASAQEASPPVKTEPSDMGGKGSKSTAWKVSKSKRWSTGSGRSPVLIAAKFSQENVNSSGGNASPIIGKQVSPTPVTESLSCELQSPSSKGIQSQPLACSLQKVSPKEPAQDTSPKLKKGKEESPGSTKSKGQGETLSKNVPRRQGDTLAKNGPEPPKAAIERSAKMAAATATPATQSTEGVRLGPPVPSTNSYFTKKSAPRKGTKSPEALPLSKNQAQVQVTDISFRVSLPRAAAPMPPSGQRPDCPERETKAPLVHQDPATATKPGLLKSNQPNEESKAQPGRRVKEQAAGHSGSIPGKAEDIKMPYQALHPPTTADQAKAPSAKNEKPLKLLGKPCADEGLKASDRVAVSPAMGTRNTFLEQHLYLLSSTKEVKKEPSAQSQAMKHKPSMVYSSAISYADALKQSPPQKFTLGIFEKPRLRDSPTLGLKARNSVDTDKEAKIKDQSPAGKDDLSVLKQQEIQEQTKSNKNHKGKVVSEGRPSNQARQQPSSDISHSDLNVADSNAQTPFPLGQAQQNSKVPKMGQAVLQPVPFTFTGAKPKFNWMTPQHLAENHFQFNSTLKREEKRKVPMSCLGQKDMKSQVPGSFITPTFPIKLQQAQRQQEQQNLLVAPLMHNSQSRSQSQTPSIVSPAMLKPPIFVFPQHLKVEAKNTGLLLSQSGGQAPQQTPVLPGSKDPLSQTKTIFLPTFPCQEIPRATIPEVFQQTGSVTSTPGKTVAHQSQMKLQNETPQTTVQVKPATKHQNTLGTMSKPLPRSQSQHKPATAPFLQPQESLKPSIQPQERSKLPIQPQEVHNSPIQSHEIHKPPIQPQERPKSTSQPQEKSKPSTQSQERPKLPMQIETKAQKSNKPPKQGKKEEEQVTVQIQDNSTTEGEVEQAIDGTSERFRPEGRWPSFQVDGSCTRKCHCKHTSPRKLPANVASWLATSRNTLIEPTWVSTLKLAGSLVAGTKFCLDYYDLKVVDND